MNCACEKTDINTVFGFWPKRNIDASWGSLLGRMKKAGVDRAFACSLQGFLYDFKEGNDLTMATCRKSDGCLIPMATINPQRHFGVIEEVDRIVEMGFKIVRFFPTEQEWSVGQRHFTRLLEKLADAKLTLMIPSTEGITNIASVTRQMPNPIIVETIRAYVHLAELIANAQDNPNLYIETHLIGSDGFIEVLAGEVGAERLIFGSGAPLHCFNSAILPIANADISAEAKEMIFSKNIARLLEL